MYYNKFISVRENAPTLPSSIRNAMDEVNNKKCNELKEKVRTRNGENTIIEINHDKGQNEVALIQLNQIDLCKTNTTTDI